MYTKTHQGVVKKTVTLEFENGYTIKLEKGVEMSMHLVMDENQVAKIKQDQVDELGAQLAANHAKLTGK